MNSDVLSLKKINEVYLQATAEPHIMRELSEHFTFNVPNARYMPQYKAGIWDGKLRLLSYHDGTIYAGLVSNIQEFCEERGYELDCDLDADESFSVHEAKEFITSLGLPSKFTPRDYQIEAFVSAIRKRRMLLLSPTGSGKSLIIYLLARFYLEEQDKKLLIIVPTISLVAQMTKDFEDYGLDSNDAAVHQIMAGHSKETDNRIVVSTWQSLFRMSKKYFDQFGMITIDECHGVKSKSLSGILTKALNVKYRFGTTGTLDGMLTNKLVVEGLLGSVHRVIETKTLIDDKVLSDFVVKAIILQHDEKVSSSLKYQEEIDHLIGNEPRNAFIKNLVLSLEGNTLVLFNYIEKHGVPLFNQIHKSAKGRMVYFVYGGTPVAERENIRAQVELEKDAIIVASVGVYSTGINIKNLSNVVFTHPGKSRIRTLQSIGRALRRVDDTEAVLYDIVDDLSCGRKMRNFALKHYHERFAIYKSEKFKVKNYVVELKTKKGTIEYGKDNSS